MSDQNREPEPPQTAPPTGAAAPGVPPTPPPPPPESSYAQTQGAGAPYTTAPAGASPQGLSGLDIGCLVLGVVGVLIGIIAAVVNLAAGGGFYTFAAIVAVVMAVAMLAALVGIARHDGRLTRISLIVAAVAGLVSSLIGGILAVILLVLVRRNPSLSPMTTGAAPGQNA